jgi:hypothetical protein
MNRDPNWGYFEKVGTDYLYNPLYIFQNTF